MDEPGAHELRAFSFYCEDKIYLGDISTKRAREILSLQETRIRSIEISRDSQLVYFSVYSGETAKHFEHLESSVLARTAMGRND